VITHSFTSHVLFLASFTVTILSTKHIPLFLLIYYHSAGLYIRYLSSHSYVYQQELPTADKVLLSGCLSVIRLIFNEIHFSIKHLPICFKLQKPLALFIFGGICLGIVIYWSFKPTVYFLVKTTEISLYNLYSAVTLRPFCPFGSLAWLA
jgi:hypothetical protein